MDRELWLSGTEELSFELTGRLPRDQGRALLAPGLGLLERDGAAEVGLTVFQMRDLRVRGLPGPGFDYSEALWRLGVSHRGRQAWYAIACDLDSVLVRKSGQLLIRYPVRPATFALTPERFEVRAAGARLDVELSPAVTPMAPRSLRPLLVASGGQLWRVPWAEVPAPSSTWVSVDVRHDTLSTRTVGPVEWASTAERLEGRGHRCGRAQPID